LVAELRHLISDDTYQPRPQQRSGPPILLAGHGNRVLTLAAQHADIVGFLGISTTTSPKGGDVGHDVFAERIAFLRGAAGDRLPRLELNLQIQAVTLDDAEPNHSFTRLIAPDLPEEAVSRQPGVLRGSAQDIAETLHRYREIYGVTYFSIPQLDMLSFGKVLHHLR
jgi:alkanesulfonate monooxygenase SsuD/methylene tetrahydromethanopterin reductase-like flavin-dependent oxidoreductase (luciferase family)